MNIPVAATITPNGMTLMIDGQTHCLTEDSHPNYAAIREAWKTQDVDAIQSLLDLTKHLDDVMDGRVTVQHGVVRLDDEPLHNVITDRILAQSAEGFDASPMMAFLANLHDNPSNQAVDELYGFLEATDLPITEDGHFLAYKMVRHDYMDNYSGTFDNSVGAVVEMPRNKVDDRRDNTCSTGLHFCSQGYLGFYGGGNHVMVLKINPRDVVSIPVDYKNAKGRACRYEIVGEIDRATANTSHTFGTSVMEAGRLGDDGVLENAAIRPWDGQFVSLVVAMDWFELYMDDDDFLAWCESNNIETSEFGPVDSSTEVVVWRTRYESDHDVDFSWQDEHDAEMVELDDEDDGCHPYREDEPDEEADEVAELDDAAEDGEVFSAGWMSKQAVANELGISTDAVRKRADRGTSVERGWSCSNGEIFRIIERLKDVTC